MAGRRKKNMSRVAAELLNKSKILIMACCIVLRDGNDLFGVSTFYSFSPGSMKCTFHLPGFVAAQMCWGLSRSNVAWQRKKWKEKCPASEKLMTCSARLSGRMAATNLKLSGCSLTATQNSRRGPVWFPESLDHIPSPRHLQVSSPVWLQSDKTRGRQNTNTATAPTGLKALRFSLLKSGDILYYCVSITVWCIFCSLRASLLSKNY